ncbi:hypothetical protein VTK73DRAFT_7762 [Phialemonium thermophilum]|uniref:Uncharacterized protein n=1 Tax=Phialemonium thermophilum TaxID=223376 RepID=A0ABR3XSP4_9PEZI
MLECWILPPCGFTIPFTPALYPLRTLTPSGQGGSALPPCFARLDQKTNADRTSNTNRGDEEESIEKYGVCYGTIAAL